MAAAKARGTALGGARAGAEARARQVAGKGTAAAQVAAIAFARDMQPILLECLAAGIIGQRAVARELNRRGVPPQQGGTWSHVQAGALLRQLGAA